MSVSNVLIFALLLGILLLGNQCQLRRYDNNNAVGRIGDDSIQQAHAIPTTLHEAQRQLESSSNEGGMDEMKKELVKLKEKLIDRESQIERLEEELSGKEDGNFKQLENTQSATNASRFVAGNTSFPLCIDWIAENNPMSFPEDSSLVRWIPLVDGSSVLTLPDTCLLHRFTGEEAQKCLANQHMVMIGDSLSRYQFLDLAYLIEHGHYSSHFGRPMNRKKKCTHMDEHGNPSCSDDNHVLMERNYGDWDKYHVDIGGGPKGGGGFFNGRLECQCVRNKANSTATLRYVSVNGTRLTFLKEQGWGIVPDLVRGWKDSGCAAKGNCSFSLEHGENLKKIYTRDFATILEDGLEKNGTVRQYVSDVDYVVYNRGIWGRVPVSRAQRLFPLLKDWAKKGCFFKSTTAGKGSMRGKSHTENERQTRIEARAAGCGPNFHVNHLTAPFANLGGKDSRGYFFWDIVHFQPWVYHELTNAFLNMICSKNDIGLLSTFDDVNASKLHGELHYLPVDPK